MHGAEKLDEGDTVTMADEGVGSVAIENGE